MASALSSESRGMDASCLRAGCGPHTSSLSRARSCFIPGESAKTPPGRALFRKLVSRAANHPQQISLSPLMGTRPAHQRSLCLRMGNSSSEQSIPSRYLLQRHHHHHCCLWAVGNPEYNPPLNSRSPFPLTAFSDFSSTYRHSLDSPSQTTTTDAAVRGGPDTMCL